MSVSFNANIVHLHIHLRGQQTVELHDGVWEMIWRDNSSAGLIICGFTLDKDAVRNDATLTRGMIYMSWPVWSSDKLQNNGRLKPRKSTMSFSLREIQN